MFCQKCGNQVDDGNRFCSYCGAEITVPVPQEPISNNSVQPIPDYVKTRQTTSAISKNMNIFFWAVWSLLLLFEIIMLSDEFTWPRCLLFLAIQGILVYLRPGFFRKLLPASLAWLAAIILVGAVIGFTGNSSEEMAFKDYADYQQVDEAALKTIDGFTAAAEKGDVKTAVSCIEGERRKQYEAMFTKDPEKLKLLGDALQDAEMSQLTSPESEADGWPRLAEYAVDYDGNTFHILMVHKDGQWMIWTI